MEENFSMEWNMEWKIFSVEWKIFGMEWKKIASMEYGKIVFFPYHALTMCTYSLQTAKISVLHCGLSIQSHGHSKALGDLQLQAKVIRRP